MLSKTLVRYYIARSEYDDLSSSGPQSVSNPNGQSTFSGNGAGQPSADPEVSKSPTVDFEKLRAKNGDVVAWLYVEGTGVNYPIVQAADNSKYLTRTFEGRSNGAGCPFLDYRDNADFTSTNSIIYGHNMNDGSMFHSLTSFKKKDFFEKNKYIWLYTPQKVYKLKIFSCFITSSFEFNSTGFDSDVDYGTYLSKVKRLSLYDCGVDVTAEDRILTLSTCTYEVDDGRFVVQAVFTDE